MVIDHTAMIGPRVLRWAAFPASILLAAAMSTGCVPGSPPHRVSDPAGTGHRPLFPLCGGVSDEQVGRLTGAADLADVSKNSVGCGWLRTGSDQGVIFAWYRNSPIGRERSVAELRGKQVDDVLIDGHRGFTARIADSPGAACETAIGFGVDFVEWAVYFEGSDIAEMCRIADEFTRETLANAG